MWMLTCNAPNVSLMRWRLGQNKFEYGVLYCSELIPQIPDTLSCLLSPSNTKVRLPIDDEIPILESCPAASEQRLMKKTLQETSFPNNSFETINAPIRSHTISSTLLMTTWKMVLMQVFENMKLKSPDNRWFDFSTICTKTVCKRKNIINSAIPSWTLEVVAQT